MKVSPVLCSLLLLVQTAAWAVDPDKLYVDPVRKPAKGPITKLKIKTPAEYQAAQARRAAAAAARQQAQQDADKKASEAQQQRARDDLKKFLDAQAKGQLKPRR